MHIEIVMDKYFEEDVIISKIVKIPLCNKEKLWKELLSK